MVDLIEDVKQRARLMHRCARARDRDALERLRDQAELRALDDAALASRVQRRHCLASLAATLGFRSWPHAKSVLGGAMVEDLGTLMHRESGGAFTNIWSASYEEARQIRAEHGGFLLPFGEHFFIAEAPYVQRLGLDPEDPDWERIGRDWPRPADRDAWTRLTARAVAARLS